MAIFAENFIRNDSANVYLNYKEMNLIVRKYNLPECNEVSLITLNELTEPSAIVLNHKDGSLKQISETHRYVITT